MTDSCLWLMVSLALVSLSSLADGAPLKVMSAPNLLRAGTAENIFVECQECSGADIWVNIYVMNHPTKMKRLAETSVTLNIANNFQQFGQIKIPADDFSKDPKVKQYVYLQAQFPDRLLEKVVLVSFQSGYIFIQTDKTIYTPNNKVLFRLFGVNSRMEPAEKDDPKLQVNTEIVTPEGIVLPLVTGSLNSGIYSGSYQLGDNVRSGLWKVLARYSSSPQQSFSAEFEVKEYVLPSFDVKLTPEISFFYVETLELTVKIKATYQFGEDVDGTAFVVFGVLLNGEKKTLSSSLQRVMIQKGGGAVTLRRQHITETFPNILNLVGSSLYVAVSVLTESGGEMVEAELRGIQIVTSPYTIYFERTPKYFHPGMPFDVLVEVVNPDETPATGVPVVVEPGSLQGITAANGLAKVIINTATGSQPLSVTVKTNDPLIPAERQAQATMVAQPYTSSRNSYIHIAVSEEELQLGNNLRFNLYLNRQSNQNIDITYLIQSRGQLVKYDRIKIQGQAIIALNIPITKDMLPSFGIVAYYHPTDNEVVSDSVWVDVKDTCMGSLKLELLRPAPSYEPRSMLPLKITGDPEATVGLVVVDKGVYVLSNKHRLTQKKVWDMVENYDTGCTPGGGKDSMGVFYDAGLLFESSTASGTPYRQELRCSTSRRRKRDTTGLDEDYLDRNEIVSRTVFPESWMWTEIKLPSCPGHDPNCKSTSIQNIALHDSLTTWHLVGISLSRSQGICVGEPLEVIVRKDFFIDLRMPYTAVVGEQIEVKAILHNYSPDPITVLVDLTKEKDLCSSAFIHGYFSQEVKIGPHTTRSVPYIVVPLKEGEFPIEVKAAVKGESLDDGIKKILLVGPEGVLIKSTQVVILDPTKQGGNQVEIINSNIPTTYLAPNTPTSTQIFIKGKENVGAVESPISGEGMGGLIVLPVGGGEQNMIFMTLPVIATVYLDETNQWETVGFQKRSEGLHHIRTGYQNQLAFRKSDGSFSSYVNLPSSTWLTAYVVKVFSMADNLVSVQTNVICDAVKFLILNTQQPQGVFNEVGKVYHAAMIGDVTGTDSDASLTAFCLIVLQNSRPICSGSVTSLPGSIVRAVSYLEKRLPQLTNPYAVAMTSYALANEGKLNRDILYKFVSPDLTHWPVNKGHIYTLEATAYALLALVKVKAFEDITRVVKWFKQQQKTNGGYGSTQATIMVYQAVAEYWASAKEPKYNLNVEVLIPGVSRPNRFLVNKDNHYATRTIKFGIINRDVKVIASGTGTATLTMVSSYYSPRTHKVPECQKFNMLVELIPEKVDDVDQIYRLRIEVLYKDRNNDATMSVLDIGLLTGFTVNTDDLNALSKGPEHTIAKYEINTVLSERGSLIIYLDKVSHTTPKIISFRIHPQLKLDVIQPAAVSIYEYYDQRHCVKFYHPERSAGQLLWLCQNNKCICGEERCSEQNKARISSEERMAKLCETTSINPTDFMYKVKLDELTQGSPSDVYKMRILKVIREGSQDLAVDGKLRTFLSFAHCRYGLDLQKGKTYIIMGTSNDVTRDDQSQSYQYMLNAGTWIEYWPTVTECLTEDYRTSCQSIEDTVSQYELLGCPN